MSRNASRGAVCGAALLAFAVTPAAPAAAKAHRHTVTLSGVVVHENNSAHSFVIAQPSGRLVAIHGRQPKVGARVRVKATRLANGTFAARRERVLARAAARKLEIAGVVTADHAASHEVVVSSTGTSIPVDTTGAAGDVAPPVGEAVDAEVEVEPDGSVKGDGVSDTGQSTSFRVEGKMLAVDDQARTLTISGDDDEATADTVTVSVPPTFDLTAFTVGECVELSVTKAADGTLTAVAAFGDGSRREANGAGQHDSPGGDGADRHGGPSGSSGGPAAGDQTSSGDRSGPSDEAASSGHGHGD